MKRVAYHRLAAKELVDSALFYEQRRAGLGEEFLAEVEVVLEFIGAHPGLGRLGCHGTRSFPTKRFPFRLVYEVQPDRIWIVAVAQLAVELDGGRHGFPDQRARDETRNQFLARQGILDNPRAIFAISARLPLPVTFRPLRTRQSVLWFNG